MDLFVEEPPGVEICGTFVVGEASMELSIDLDLASEQLLLSEQVAYGSFDRVLDVEINEFTLYHHDEVITTAHVHARYARGIAADYIKSCSRNDPNLNECALKSARESLEQFARGDTSRKLPPLDPLYVSEMTVYIPNENGLKLVFKDNYFHGLSDMKLEKLKFDLNKKVIYTNAVVNLDVHNKYDLSGKLMIVPITSNGDSSIKLKNTVLQISLWYEHVTGPDGKIHWKIINHDIKYNIEKAVFRLENLLGDKAIGDQVNLLLNELWREIVADVGPSVCNSLIEAVVETLGVLLAQVPYDELMPE
ncbi:circadian clock-controlled protein daywake-like [Achroia grisella]|uniref:circadian clock-controlled protein daywake-like n=1 Tax=Achroia grisella TaxID=688607 RepID=UPI0027D23750|nr:circadian clock-controlled protein daywake-like [Achroia grisella]